MRRLLAILAPPAAALVAGAAQGDAPGVALLFVGIWIAVMLAIAMPTSLMLHTLRPDWIAASASAFERRKTACLLVGAGLLVVTAIVLRAAANRSHALAALLAAPALAWFLVGFAGCARRQGERLLGTSAGVRPLVIGWLARAGAVAVPLLWPVIGAYVVVGALGAPAVALLARPAPPPST